ncbi:phosducin family protein [Boeremia exigua]|uniref:phosducin family protein n=1 Tax=Boeremia exigua TaxID=749465 RepID=UPI001E8D49C2|nr:phosducin family protein [Boeremia exigua]KAH6619922.1 phosducin family protein [Boeremia exigua]
MQMPDMPINVEVDPNEDTEWNDILRSKGIIPEKPPSPTPMIEEALNEARRLAHENRLEGKELDELAELEDEEDEDFLEIYRQKRMNELSAITSASIYNQVYHVQKPDYSRDVTDASQKAWILVLLTSSTGTNTESRVASESWTLLAQRFGDVKFCTMRADLCIEGYPDRNTPTVLVYKDGDIKKQIVTLRELGGVRAKVEDWEKVLVDLGAVKIGDSRLSRRPGQEEEEKTTGIRQGKTMVQADDDSDWD